MQSSAAAAPADDEVAAAAALDADDLQTTVDGRPLISQSFCRRN